MSAVLLAQSIQRHWGWPLDISIYDLDDGLLEAKNPLKNYPLVRELTRKLGIPNQGKFERGAKPFANPVTKSTSRDRC